MIQLGMSTTPPKKLDLYQRCILALHYEYSQRELSTTDEHNRQVYIHGYIELSGIKVWNETKKTFEFYVRYGVTDHKLYGFCEGSAGEAELRKMKLDPMLAGELISAEYKISSLLTKHSSYMDNNNQGSLTQAESYTAPQQTFGSP